MVMTEMNIFALKGYKVKVTEGTKNNGYDSDSRTVAEHLELEKEYTVDSTMVHNFSTDVHLVEFPNVIFNSVNFEEVTEQSEEMDAQHPDYKKYN